MEDFFRSCAKRRANPKDIFARNEYPEDVINREISKFVANHTKVNWSKQQMEPKLENSLTFLVLPFASQKAEGFAKKIKSVVNEFYPQIGVQDTGSNRKAFSQDYKDNIKSNFDRSLVIYRIKT